jgi:hypothetical protein
VQPASGLTVLEMVAMIVVAKPGFPRLVMLETAAMIIIGKPEVSRLVMPPLMPPRSGCIVLELGRPRLRSEVAAPRVPMMHELRAVALDDAEIERVHHIRVDRCVPVGGCRRRQQWRRRQA